MTTTTSKTTASKPSTLTSATLDVAASVLTFGVDPWLRWTVKGWAEHLRASRHANHAANSFAKHALEFVQTREIALALTVARCVDFGLTPEEARELIDERMKARASKAS